MRTFFVSLAVAALWVGVAHAQAKKGEPGYYAEHSTVFAQYLANCGPGYKLRGSAEDRDKVARKLEKLVETNKEQYNLQVEGCRAEMPRQVASAEQPAPEIAAPSPVRTYPDEGTNAQARALSPNEESQLASLLDRKAVQMLGPRPRNSRGYVGDKPRHMGLPPGCVERKVPDYRLHRMFVRVTCSRQVYH